MAGAQTYKTRALVLRKTKLGERDLVVTLLDDTGGIIRAVAKGARKPGGTYAAKLELFGCLDLMLARGRSLDIVTDARFAPDHPAHTFDLEQSACAAAVAELLSFVCQEGLEQPRLFEMAESAFAHIADATPDDALAIATAALMKIVSSAGFKPSLDNCAVCNTPLDLSNASSSLLFGTQDGGVICQDCARKSEGVYLNSTTLSWTKALLYTRFDDIPNIEIPTSKTFDVLQLAKTWIEFHIGHTLKSLTYLFTSALY